MSMPGQTEETAAPAGSEEPRGETGRAPTPSTMNWRRAAIKLQAKNNLRRQTFKHVAKDGTLSAKVKFSWALPQFSLTSLTMLIGIHGTLFYETIGTPLSFIAFFTAVARSFDVMTDPLMAWFSDNFRHPMGRRRPFMRYASIGYSVMFIMFMSPPASLQNPGFWFGFTYILFYLFDTLANVPYSALGPELTDDYSERNSLFLWQKFFGALGTMVGAVGPAVLGVAMRDQRAIFATLAWGFGIYYFFFMQNAVNNITEREQSSDTEPIPIVPSILRSFKNRAFRPLLVGWVLDYVALSALATMLPFFIRFVVKPTTISSTSLLGICLGSLLLAGMISMPFWMLLVQRFGKRNVWLAYNLVNSTTCALYSIVGEGDVVPLILVTILNGFPTGGQFLIDSILADVIDYDEFLNGTRSEGGFTVFATFIPKVVSIPAQAIPLAVISAVGFKPSVNGVDQEQTPLVKNYIIAVFVMLPTVCTLISFCMKLLFPIRTKRQVDMIGTGIELHMMKKPAPDPVTQRMVSLLELTKDEQQACWLLDNFSTSNLQRLHDGEDPSFLIKRMTRFVVIGSLVSGLLFMTMMMTLSLLEDSAVAWIPSFSVICTGMSTVTVVFNYLRLRAARDIVAKPPPKALIARVLENKGKGQRGGDPMKSAALSPEQIAHEHRNYLAATEELSKILDASEGADVEMAPRSDSVTTDDSEDLKKDNVALVDA